MFDYSDFDENESFNDDEVMNADEQAEFERMLDEM